MPFPAITNAVGPDRERDGDFSPNENADAINLRIAAHLPGKMALLRRSQFPRVATIAVVFQSGKGHTRILAEAVLKGIRQVPEVSGRIFEIAAKDVHEGRYTNLALMEWDRDLIFFASTQLLIFEDGRWKEIDYYTSY